MSNTCPLCAGQRHRPLYHAPGFDHPEENFQLRQCETCGLVATHPGADQLDLARYYRADYYGSGEQKFVGPIEQLTRLANRARIRALQRHLPARTADTPRSILDIGCGRGHLLRSLQQQGWICHGLERPEFTGEAPPGVTLHRNTLEQSQLPGDHFDAVILWHVLEHLPNPATALHEIARILRPGGVVAIAVPNFASWQARHLRRHWPHLDLPRHLYHFTPATLSHALEQNKLHPIARESGSFEQDLFGSIQGLFNALGLPHNGLFHQLKGERSPLTLPLWGFATLLTLPLALLESLTARFSGQSATLILYAQKPEQ